MTYIPLAENLRPKTLEQVVGQTHIIGWLRRIIDGGKPLSILLFGPPGCGKTTLARLYANAFDATFVPFSPIFQGVADLKKAIADSKNHPLLKRRLLIFSDEIHRFNKAQQDAFLPYVESGEITLVGATTENPSFSLNNALLSRLRVLTLDPLKEEDLLSLIEKAGPLPITEDAKKTLVKWSNGDARYLFNMLETLSLAPKEPLIDSAQLSDWIQKKGALYDKKDEGHYNLISALHKSIRGSDPDAALYWLSRMMIGGEDRQFLARRMIRMASEDIGLADPNALQVTINAWHAYNHLGTPEGDLPLAEAVVYLALAPKSNAIYTAFKAALQKAKDTDHLPPPKIILNAPTKLMKEQGYGEGYIYDHDTPNGFSGQNYFPDRERACFYSPKERGFERDLKKRIEYFNKLRFSQDNNSGDH